MHDLIARIRAAIDEDERVARGAAERCGPGWRLGRYADPADPFADGIHAERGEVVSSGEVMVPEGDHIVRHDPARVLRQVAAHRKILELHDQPETHEGFIYCRTCGSGEPLEYPTAWPCPTLLALAEAYGIALTGR